TKGHPPCPPFPKKYSLVRLMNRPRYPRRSFPPAPENRMRRIVLTPVATPRHRTVTMPRPQFCAVIPIVTDATSQWFQFGPTDTKTTTAAPMIHLRHFSWP